MATLNLDRDDPADDAVPAFQTFQDYAHTARLALMQTHERARLELDAAFARQAQRLEVELARMERDCLTPQEH